MQLLHSEVKRFKHNREIILICENLHRPDNLGMALRMCDALGVRILVLPSDSISVSHPKVRAVARNTENSVNVQYIENCSSYINEIKTKGIKVIGLELSLKSKPLYNANFSGNDSVVFVIGDEANGISENILNILDEIYFVPMYGENSSMNVIMAATIGIWEFLRQQY